MDEEKLKRLLGELARIVFAIVALYCIWDVIKTQALFFDWEPDASSAPASVSAPASTARPSAAS